MSDLQGVEIVDAIPGRLRLRVDQVKRNPFMAAMVEKELSAIPGILRVEARSTTGSVLVQLDPTRLNTPHGLQALTGALRELFREVSDEDLNPWMNQLQNWLAATA